MSPAAWQQIAIGEEAAIYAYGVLSAELVDSERNRAIHAMTAHARARDRARAQLSAAGESPAAPVVFEIPFRLEGSAAARRLAALCESRLVDVYCTVVPDLQGTDREYASQAARECAARAVVWGDRPQAFPGAEAPAMGAPEAPVSSGDGAAVQ